MRERFIATAKYQDDGGPPCAAYLSLRTSSKHGRHVHAYRWLNDGERPLDGMSRGHSAARMLEAARRDPRFFGIVVMDCEE